jgi:hypothetical protein
MSAVHAQGYMAPGLPCVSLLRQLREPKGSQPESQLIEVSVLGGWVGGWVGGRVWDRIVTPWVPWWVPAAPVSFAADGHMIDCTQPLLNSHKA